jgi:hypothetical protein
MIAYSAMFLLKVLVRFPSVVHVDASRAFELIEQIVVVFKAARSTEQHLTTHIADGLEKLLDSCRNGERAQFLSDHPIQGYERSYQFPILSGGLDSTATVDSFGIVSPFPLDSGLDMFFTSEHPG